MQHLTKKKPQQLFKNRSDTEAGNPKHVNCFPSLLNKNRFINGTISKEVHFFVDLYIRKADE